MILFPAIDILDGKAVRLTLGKRETATVYGNPADLAKKWADFGAEFLHVVDLNAAFDGVYVNDKIISEIVRTAGIPVQLGGGFKDMDRMELCLNDMGVRRAVIGSAAVTNPVFFREAAAVYGERIICGVDEKNGKVSIKGWLEDGGVKPSDLCATIKAVGIKTVVYTDVSKDGALSGVNVESSFKLQNESGLNVIASGGVASLTDIKRLKERGLYGVILGKALYVGTIDLKEASAVAAE
ncbi:MAG: 1-(5-phosphoribosyl)-5-[(5-phosphoribosylamino)methylideneamino]imidazole-4-carboxamide isomerase [Clostridiales bacterium]|jgi:phosphoribosylformimino-5-aminoimidazole carboxamide ribotide isomerase|nr:1-(5-phosphoribosyl)-5-[(5-phosphoribosylamino)methylideneamino]imidazole-4-carboxamide isomerase [Clostridiales bacterium]